MISIFLLAQMEIALTGTEIIRQDLNFTKYTLLILIPFQISHSCPGNETVLEDH